jgi:GNAT superfamily N-acetyltransferase
MAVSIRRVESRDDEQVSLALYNEVWPRHAVTMDEVDSVKAAVVAHADLLAEIDGQPAGSAFIAIYPHRRDVCFVLLTVLPAYRRRGLGTGLYRKISRWCRDHGIDTIDAQAEENDSASLSFAERRGFVEIERNGGMELELAYVDTPMVDAPPGIEIVTWSTRPDLARGIYAVAVEAYVDVPGTGDDEMEPFEDWLAHDMQGSGDRPEATFVALEDDEVVGYAKFSLTAAQPTVAFHDMTGVRRAWRGRGIAGALKRAQIRWAKEQGYERLVTGNEVRNEPIRRLNRRLGYREAPGRVLLRGPLADAPA